MAQFFLKIAHLSFSMGPAPSLKMVFSYGLRPRLWLLLHSQGLLSWVTVTYFTPPGEGERRQGLMPLGLFLFIIFLGGHFPQTSSIRSAKQILVASFATRARACIYLACILFDSYNQSNLIIWVDPKNNLLWLVWSSMFDLRLTH